MIDLQVNGVGRVDFAVGPSVGGYRAAAADLAGHGVTGFLATIPTQPADRYSPALDASAAAIDGGVPGVLGVHLEGPFLHPDRRGAHPAGHLRAPDPAWLATVCDARPGLVRLVTLAPELPGAAEVVAACRDRAILVAVGHSRATADEAAAAAPDMVTHLFNAMEPFHHRMPGLVGWALTDPDVVCGLIADGVHVHPRALRLAFAAKGPAGIALVSDAVAAREGLTDDGGAWRLPDGTLAGASTYLDHGVEVCIRAQVPPGHAAAAATDTPARLLGLL